MVLNYLIGVEVVILVTLRQGLESLFEILNGLLPVS